MSKGGDTGHGGYTYFSLKDHACTDMRIRCTELGIDWTSIDKFELFFGGDTEHDTFLECLEMALNMYRKKFRGGELSTSNVDDLPIGK